MRARIRFEFVRAINGYECLGSGGKQLLRHRACRLFLWFPRVPPFRISRRCGLCVELRKNSLFSQICFNTRHLRMWIGSFSNWWILPPPKSITIAYPSRNKKALKPSRQDDFFGGLYVFWVQVQTQNGHRGCGVRPFSPLSQWHPR